MQVCMKVTRVAPWHECTKMSVFCQGTVNGTPRQRKLLVCV